MQNLTLNLIMVCIWDVEFVIMASIISVDTVLLSLMHLHAMWKIVPNVPPLTIAYNVIKDTM